MQVFFQHKKCRPGQPVIGWESILSIPSVNRYWLVVRKRSDQCWWFSLFRENRWFWFLGQVLKTAPVLIKTFFPHSDNCPGFQKLKENLVKRFSGSAVLKEF
jgi:hypothetical protein